MGGLSLATSTLSTERGCLTLSVVSPASRSPVHSVRETHHCFLASAVSVCSASLVEIGLIPLTESSVHYRQTFPFGSAMACLPFWSIPILPCSFLDSCGRSGTFLPPTVFMLALLAHFGSVLLFWGNFLLWIQLWFPPSQTHIVTVTQ